MYLTGAATPLNICTNRVNGNSRKIVVPNTKCSLNIIASPMIKSAAPLRNVTICCAQFARAIIELPSMCCAENGMVIKPVISCTYKKSRIIVSDGLLVARMRGSNSLRIRSMVMPMKQIVPKTPPATIAIICLVPESMK